MSSSLTPQQTLYLWYLIGKGGNWLDTIKPELDAPERIELEKLGLITNEKREREAPSRSRKSKSKSKSSRKQTAKKPSKAGWIEITDKGWGWANDHLTSPLPTQTKNVGPILQAWLNHLHAFLQREGKVLADIVADPKSPTRAELATPIALEERIKSAYLDATGGSWNQRVRLSELRYRLDGVAKEILDATLLKMQQASKLVLFRLDNQREITDADRQAALFVGGEPRHVLHMGG